MISKVRVLEKLSFSKMLNGLSAITKKITGANQQERTSNKTDLEKMFEDWFLLYQNVLDRTRRFVNDTPFFWGWFCHFGDNDAAVMMADELSKNIQ